MLPIISCTTCNDLTIAGFLGRIHQLRVQKKSVNKEKLKKVKHKKLASDEVVVRDVY